MEFRPLASIFPPPFTGEESREPKVLRSIAVCVCAILFMHASVAAPAPTIVRRHHTIEGQKIDFAAVIIPANSPVRYKGADKRNIEAVEFEGRFVLSGKYHFGWERRFGQWFASIIPDKGVAARLPSFEEVGGAQEIFLSNPQEFGKAVLSKAEFRKVSRGRGQATGRTQIRADRLYAYVQCGYPWYSARFLEVVKPAPTVLAKAWEFDSC